MPAGRWLKVLTMSNKFLAGLMVGVMMGGLTVLALILPMTLTGNPEPAGEHDAAALEKTSEPTLLAVANQTTTPVVFEVRTAGPDKIQHLTVEAGTLGEMDITPVQGEDHVVLMFQGTLLALQPGEPITCIVIEWDEDSTLPVGPNFNCVQGE